MKPIPAGRVLLLLFVFALGLVAYVQYRSLGALYLIVQMWPQGAPRGGLDYAAAAGELLGGALLMVALPAVVIVPWRAIQRWRRRRTNGPITAGVILFVAVALVILVGTFVRPA